MKYLAFLPIVVALAVWIFLLTAEYAYSFSFSIAERHCTVGSGLGSVGMTIRHLPDLSFTPRVNRAPLPLIDGTDWKFRLLAGKRIVRSGDSFLLVPFYLIFIAVAVLNLAILFVGYRLRKRRE